MTSSVSAAPLISSIGSDKTHAGRLSFVRKSCQMGRHGWSVIGLQSLLMLHAQCLAAVLQLLQGLHQLISAAACPYTEC